MTIYNWWGGEGGAGYIGCSEEDDRATTWYDRIIGDPLPSLERWKTPAMTQYLGGTGRRKPRPVRDAVSSASVNIVSENAAESLSDIWDRHAILYPINLDDADQNYYMVVVTTELDCLDRENSAGPLQKYGPTPDLYASIHTWTFDIDCVGDTEIFTIPDSRTTIFVNDAFKKRVADAGLTGFCLRHQFWDENPWVS